nr:energy transducer TonB [Xenococcaceae cyanobacterium MO_188.B19]
PQTKPNPSSKPKTPVSSGSASLLGGTQRRSLSDDSGSSFFNPKVNASQQALNSRGLDARQNIDLGPYFAEIRRRVRRNWKPSQPRKERHTILVFSIQRNGQITGLRIVQSSGSPINDQESLEAVQKSAPFRALPANFPRQELKVQFNFNIYFN